MRFKSKRKPKEKRSKNQEMRSLYPSLQQNKRILMSPQVPPHNPKTYNFVARFHQTMPKAKMNRTRRPTKREKYRSSRDLVYKNFSSSNTQRSSIQPNGSPTSSKCFTSSMTGSSTPPTQNSENSTKSTKKNTKTTFWG